MDPLKDRRFRLLAAVLAALLTFGVLALAVALMDPLPPRTVVMATGPDDSAYGEVGRRYQAVLARHGVRLELRATRGGVENLQLLGDQGSGVSVALAQGGLTTAAGSPGVVSLGTMFYEPVWLFEAGAGALQPGARSLQGRVFIDRPGSGTRALADTLLPAIGLDLGSAEVVDMTATEAGEALLRGELSLMVTVNAWEVPLVQRLAAAPAVTTVPALRADAQVALRPYLSKLMLPRGVADLVTDRPPEDVPLIAAKASLLVRDDLHPAIAYLLLEAASEVHGAPGIFQRAGQFPAAEPMDVPLAVSAREYYRSGRPFIYRYLPFWLASLASQLVLLLIPVVGVLYPLFRLVPLAYGGIMRLRIFRLYGELKFLEAELDTAKGGEALQRLGGQLENLEQRANHLRVPEMYADRLYTLRLHINLVRSRLATVRGSSGG
ncbi:MAG: hypothetical protein JNM50_01235 [Chromatiales bacterium]|jgi:TRAP-type uncharacterized transport system substrate-binding protein|nr:hypothetical protein [Chromatiales bacterium]